MNVHLRFSGRNAQESIAGFEVVRVRRLKKLPTRFPERLLRRCRRHSVSPHPHQRLLLWPFKFQPVGQARGSDLTVAAPCMSLAGADVRRL